MSSFWDEFKDLFKTKSQKDKEKAQALKDALDKENEITAKLEELDKAYRDSQASDDEEIDLEKLFPSSSGLKEIEYTPQSDEDIYRQAEKNVDYQKTLARNKLESNFESAYKGLQNSANDAQSNLKEGYKKLEDLYSELRRNAENDALKRGVARSSIILNQLDKLDGAHLGTANELEAAYVETIGNINGQIASLERGRETALDELDLKSASDLSNRIDELKKERDSAVAQYEKYNNTVREKESAYAKRREEDIADYLNAREREKLEKEKEIQEYESKYGYSGEKQKNYSERYGLAYDFYMSLSPDIALQALEASPNMKYYLGNYYNTLKNALSGRNASSTKKYY